MKTIQIIKQLDKAIMENNFSGVVSIRKNNEVIYEKASGYGDRSNKRLNSIDTRFAIASGTKLFTALGIGKLIEGGHISLDTKAFGILDYPFESYSKDVTIKDLLTHTSGIPDYYDEDKIEKEGALFLDVPWYDLKSPANYFPVFPKEQMIFTPGEKFTYNNSGYVLLAAIIAKVSQTSYVNYISENIFNALNMSHSGFYPLNALPENTAYGYMDNDSLHTNIYELPIIGGGDGGIYTTVNDLYLFWDALYNYKILSKELTDQFLTPAIKAESEGEHDYYGYGIWIYNDKKSPYEEYIIGCDPGISFKSTVLRENDIIYTVISNTENGAWALTKAIYHLEL